MPQAVGRGPDFCDRTSVVNIGLEWPLTGRWQHLLTGRAPMMNKISSVASALIATSIVCAPQITSTLLIAREPSAGLGIQGSPDSGGVHVEGKHLVSNGHTFLVKGVQIVGFVAPGPLLTGQYARAHAHFGEAELRAAEDFGANVLRFQVSQTGLDPESENYSHSYVAELQDAIGAALNRGFRVIVSLQHQRPSGSSQLQRLPSQNTLRVWHRVAPLWANDKRVMYELYNEPGIPATSRNWHLWLNGGVLRSNPDHLAVGMQQLIDEVRSTGAKNVLIVPGLATEHTLQGALIPRDPMRNLAFGIHSPELAGGPPKWASTFGYLSSKNPVIVTEWAASGRTRGCTAAFPSQAAAFVRFLQEKGIGVVGFAFDIPGTIVEDWSYRPTRFRDFQCSGHGRRAIGGQGSLLHHYFTEERTDSTAGSA